MIGPNIVKNVIVRLTQMTHNEDAIKFCPKLVKWLYPVDEFLKIFPVK